MLSIYHFDWPPARLRQTVISSSMNPQKWIQQLVTFRWGWGGGWIFPSATVDEQKRPSRFFWSVLFYLAKEIWVLFKYKVCNCNSVSKFERGMHILRVLKKQSPSRIAIFSQKWTFCNKIFKACRGDNFTRIHQIVLKNIDLVQSYGVSAKKCKNWSWQCNETNWTGVNR